MQVKVNLQEGWGGLVEGEDGGVVEGVDGVEEEGVDGMGLVCGWGMLWVKWRGCN